MLFGREIFGPVLVLVPVRNVDEAIAFVNSRYLCFVVRAGRLMLSFSTEIYLSVFTSSRMTSTSRIKVSTPNWPIIGLRGLKPFCIASYGQHAKWLRHDQRDSGRSWRYVDLICLGLHTSTLS